MRGPAVRLAGAVTFVNIMWAAAILVRHLLNVASASKSTRSPRLHYRHHPPLLGLQPCIWSGLLIAIKGNSQPCKSPYRRALY